MAETAQANPTVKILKQIQKPQHQHVSSKNWAKWTDPKP